MACSLYVQGPAGNPGVARSWILMLLVGPFQFRKFNESMVVKMNLFSEGVCYAFVFEILCLTV